MLAPHFISPHLGLTILSLAGRLIHSWKPCSILSSVGAGISLWMMPRPAVIHCTPPGPMTPCKQHRKQSSHGSASPSVLHCGSCTLTPGLQIDAEADVGTFHDAVCEA